MTIPIIIIGMIILICKNTNVTPTANASILVAIARVKSVGIEVISSFFLEEASSKQRAVYPNMRALGSKYRVFEKL